MTPYSIRTTLGLTVRNGTRTLPSVQRYYTAMVRIVAEYFAGGQVWHQLMERRVDELLSRAR
jgi:hypothetical protein